MVEQKNANEDIEEMLVWFEDKHEKEAKDVDMAPSNGTMATTSKGAALEVTAAALEQRSRDVAKLEEDTKELEKEILKLQVTLKMEKKRTTELQQENGEWVEHSEVVESKLEEANKNIRELEYK